MKWWQKHFDVITTIWRQAHRKEKETMAPEVVTDGKNDKTEKND